MKKYFYFIILLAASVVYSARLGVNMRITREIITEWAIISFIAVFFLKNMWIRLFLIWAVIRVGIDYHVLPSAKYAYMSLQTLFIYLMAYQVIINTLKKKHIGTILDAICLVAWINVIWAYFQCHSLWILAIPSSREMYFDIVAWNGRVVLTHTIVPMITGLQDNPNVLAQLLVVSLPAFLRRRYLVFGICVSAMIIKIGCLGGTIPMIIIWWIWIAYKFKRLRKYIVMIPIFIGLACLSIYADKIVSFDGTGRFAEWVQMYNNYFNIHHSWFYGWGLGSFKVFYPVIQARAFHYTGALWIQAHNEYIQLFLELGIIGFVLCMGYFISLIIKVWKYNARNSFTYICCLGVLATLINAVGSFTFHLTIIVISILYLTMLEKGELWQDTFIQEKRRTLN